MPDGTIGTARANASINTATKKRLMDVGTAYEEYQDGTLRDLRSRRI